MKITIAHDFETFSEADIKSVGGEEYARHPSTEVICLAWAVNDEEPQIWVAGRDDAPHELLKLVERGATLTAWNAAFEIAMWREIMVKKHGWPMPRLSQFHCSMAQGRHAGLPGGLDMAAKALGLEVEKDGRGRQIMLKYCKPRKPSKHNPSTRHNDPDELAQLYAYCKQDVVVERAISQTIPPLPKKEQDIWLLDQRINQRGVPCDRELCEAAISVYDRYSESLLAELCDLTDGEVTTAAQVSRMVKWAVGRGTNIDNLRAPTIEELLARDDLDPKTRRLCEIRRDLSLASLKKYDAILRWTTTDGRARGVHQYYGAGRTGRWAGRGIQMQNIARGVLKPEELEGAADAVLRGNLDEIDLCYRSVPDTLSSLVRSAIRAEDV